MACSHFANVRRDFLDGVLSEQEWREKPKEVYDDARVSEIPGIAEGARQLLASVTSGDIEGFAEGAATFTKACSSVDPL